MFRVFCRKTRFYCTTVAKSDIKSNLKSKKLNFDELKHRTKVPQTPVQTQFTVTNENITIDSKTIQLLERLSLVDLDSKEALTTLKSSIQFANKIAHIDTTNVEPLYTVLERQPLQLRNDEVTEGNSRPEILANAKITDEDYFVSPPGNIPLEQEEKSFEK